MDFTISYTGFVHCGIISGLSTRAEHEAMEFFRKHPGPTYTLYCGAWIIGDAYFSGEVDIVVEPDELYPLYEKACTLREVICEAEKAWGRKADILLLMAQDLNADGSRDYLLLRWYYGA